MTGGKLRESHYKIWRVKNECFPFSGETNSNNITQQVYKYIRFRVMCRRRRRVINLEIIVDLICTYPWIMKACKLVRFLPRDHEDGQVGSVRGQENDSKHGPHVNHEST